MGKRVRITIGAVTVGALLLASSCTRESGPPGLRVPTGAMARMEVKIEGRICGFGPFVGYYFRPYALEDLSRVHFWTFNEDRFYSSDAPPDALLFEGEAVLGHLTDTGFTIPEGRDRINPVFFPDAPGKWVDSRPKPQDEFLHFHSVYDRSGPVLWGYWLRHQAVAAFTYDMGGRVGPDSPLYHEVEPGPDLGFPRIIEFDSGPPAAGP